MCSGILEQRLGLLDVETPLFVQVPRTWSVIALVGREHIGAYDLFAGVVNWANVYDTFDGAGGTVVPGYNRIKYTIKLLKER
jgi:hypothetical protein